MIQTTLKAFSWRNIAAVATIFGLALAMMFSFAAPALAHESPADCTNNDFALNLGKDKNTVYDETNPLGATVITYTVSTGNPNTSGSGCDVDDVDVTLTTPDGTVHALQTGGSYPIGTAISTLGSVPYTVDSADGTPLVASAQAVGDLHDVDGNDPLSISKQVTSHVINPDTTVDISASANTVYAGSTVDLTVTETNTGDTDLENISVDVDNGVGTLTKASGSFVGGDADADDELDDGETWTWNVAGVTVNTDTTFTAVGHGTDSLDNDITVENGFATEEDTVDVEVIDPSTIVEISASALEVQDGDTVDLTVTEENNGDTDLTNVSVVVNDGTSDIATLTAAPDSGDNGNNILEVGETWSWTISGVTVNGNTQYTATGHGTDEIGNDVTWIDACTEDGELLDGILCDSEEVDEVLVTTVSPSTNVTIASSEAMVQTGDTVTLTITETNDGQVDLTDAFVDLQPMGTTLDETHGNFASDGNLDSTLNTGETWTWTVDAVVGADTIFMATGHGTDALGNDVTWCDNPEGVNEGVTCDQDEKKSVEVTTKDPSTDVTITSSEAEVQDGDTVDLTVMEINDGDVDLTNPSVVVDDGTTDIETLIAAPDSGDVDNDGILDAGETWTWTVSGVVVTGDTTFTATGHGTDALGNDVTWCSNVEQPGDNVLCDQDEQDSIRVLTVNPSTDASASVDADVVLSGDTVTLTFTETNDGDVDLTNPFIEVSPLGLTLDETDAEFVGGDDGDGVLNVGETWEWQVTDNPTADETYVVIGHGTDTLGNDVTWCDNPEGDNVEVICDQDERAEVSVDVINPSTDLTLTADAVAVATGDTVTLTIEEVNDGDVDLTDPYVDVDNGVGTLDENSANFTGDADDDGELDAGETWAWTVDVVVNATITYTATGHGLDPLGNDITAPAYPEEEDSITIEVVEFAGCTPGFWKNHTDLWGNTTFQEAFGNDVFGEDMTLLEVASQGGGGLKALGRHAVAAYLNAGDEDVPYPLTQEQIVDKFNDVVSDPDADKHDFNELKDEFGEFNEEGCSIDAHGNPIEDEELEE